MSIEITAKMKVETKKNTAQECTFLITQQIPYPRLSARGCWVEWQGGDGVIFSTYGQKPSFDLKRVYYVAQLKDGVDIKNLDHSRKDHAGYEGNAGSIVYKGVDLGELTFTLSFHAYQNGLVPSFEEGKYTPGQVDFIKREICPAIIKKISQKEKALKKQAIAKLQANMKRHIADFEEGLDKAKAEAREALARMKEEV